jgi:hypothetical protein
METEKSFGHEVGNKQNVINKWLSTKTSKLKRRNRNLDVFISPLCLTCIEYIIEMKRLYAVLTTLRIKVVFYCEGSKKEAKTLKTDFHLPYKVISVDHKSQIWISSNVIVTPFYVLRNKKGEMLSSGRFTEDWAQTKSLLLEEFQKSKTLHP